MFNFKVKFNANVSVYVHDCSAKRLNIITVAHFVGLVWVSFVAQAPLRTFDPPPSAFPDGSSRKLHLDLKSTVSFVCQNKVYFAEQT